MYFALGVLVAGLLALIFLPAFWRRALRLSMRRLQMLMPLSMEEVVAERDLLRAEFAVRERRLEQEMDAVKAARALDLADIGRHAARVADAEAALKKTEAAMRDMEMQLREAQRVVVERTDLLSSTELALQEMTERAQRGVERARLLETDKEELGRQTEAQQSRVATHEAKIADLHARNTRLQHDLQTTRAELDRAAQEAARVPGLTAEAARLAAELESATAKAAALARELAESRAARDASDGRHKNDVDHFENALRAARAEARDHADKLEATRGDLAMLQGAVEALRAERAEMRRAASALSIGGDDAHDTAALRAAIVDFGDRVADLAAKEAAARRA